MRSVNYYSCYRPKVTQLLSDGINILIEAAGSIVNALIHYSTSAVTYVSVSLSPIIINVSCSCESPSFTFYVHSAYVKKLIDGAKNSSLFVLHMPGWD